jgi:choline dehydrogenase
MSGFDYIVIGGGSAGCIVAARLSEDSSAKVLLLEAGPANRGLKVTMPLGVALIAAKKNPQNWGFMGEPEPYLNNRQIFCARGRGLGGSSAINGMLYVRGNRADYDQWQQMGLRGWGYDDVLPYFMKSENHVDGADEFHGAGGPLHIDNADAPNPLNDAIVAAAQEAGFPFTPDFNGAQQEGFGWYDCNIKAGRRGSSAAMFVEPVKHRPNLTIMTDARITRIIVKNGRATGVDFVRGKRQQVQTIQADREIVLSAGVIQSPHILQLSGIGDPARLAVAGIKPAHHLPGVGANLHDHLDVGVGNECPEPVTLFSAVGGLKALTMGLEYLLFKRGVAALPFAQVGGFAKSRPGLDRPDMQLVVVPAMVADGEFKKTDAFTFHFCQLDPESRGRIDSRSADPFADPKILFNYLSTDKDRLALRNCVKVARDVISQSAMARFRGPEILPGDAIRSDAEIDAWVRQNASTVYHPVGSCRMGVKGDAMAVVDDELRVFGIEGLRIADASVMPTVISGNTNAPAMMIGEKAADMIRRGSAELTEAA